MAFMVAPLKIDQTVSGLVLNIVSGGLTFCLLGLASKDVGSENLPPLRNFDVIRLPLLSKIPILGEILSSIAPGCGGKASLSATVGAALLADYRGARRVPRTVQGAAGPGHPLPSRGARLAGN
jgi:ABC-type uncharacterized transport system permease subunit